jgi:hypothetical protein
MHEDARWRRAADADDRFLPFRRYRPDLAAVAAAAAAAITLAGFVVVGALGLGTGWLAGLVTLLVTTGIGGGLALLRNRQAQAQFVAEYRRLNKIAPDSGQQQTKPGVNGAHLR